MQEQKRRAAAAYHDIDRGPRGLNLQRLEARKEVRRPIGPLLRVRVTEATYCGSADQSGRLPKPVAPIDGTHPIFP